MVPHKKRASKKQRQNPPKKCKKRRRFRSQKANEKIRSFLSEKSREPADLRIDRRLRAGDVSTLCSVLSEGAQASQSVAENTAEGTLSSTAQAVSTDSEVKGASDSKMVDDGDAKATFISQRVQQSDIAKMRTLKSLLLKTTKIRPAVFRHLLSEGLAKTRSLKYLNIVGEYYILRDQWVALGRILESTDCPVHTLSLRKNRYWSKNLGAPVELARSLASAPNLRHLSVDDSLQEQVLVALADNPSSCNLRHLYLCSPISASQAQNIQRFLASKEAWLDSLTLRGHFESDAVKRTVLNAICKNDTLIEWSVFDCKRKERVVMNQLKRAKSQSAAIRGFELVMENQSSFVDDILGICKELTASPVGGFPNRPRRALYMS